MTKLHREKKKKNMSTDRTCRGKWWMRVDQPELRSRQRRNISRAVRRLISREANGIDRFIGELRHSIAEMRGSVGAERWS